MLVGGVKHGHCYDHAMTTIDRTIKVLILFILIGCEECPQLRVTFIVPITSNGDTAELHAWYEVLPDSSVAAKSVAGN